MKSTYINNVMGSIQVDDEVIAQYAGSVAVECFGIVGMASVNMKEGIVNLLKKDKITHGITVGKDEDGNLMLQFHVIVSYGVSIQTVADNLIENVKYKVEAFTGLKITKIHVIVEGVRNID